MELELQRVDQVLVSVQSLYSYAFGLTRNRDDAEDLLQETLLRAVLAINMLAGDATMKAWLRRIMRNLFVDVVRRRSLESRYLSNPVNHHNVGLSYPEHQLDSYEMCYAHQLQQFIRTAVDDLSPHHAEVIDLHYTNQMSICQIAIKIGVSEGTVRSRLARARSRLRETLVEYLQLENDHEMTKEQ